jgi:hypothetical protein
MDSIDSADELQPSAQWTRRGFVMTSLITGFALSMQPVYGEACSDRLLLGRPGNLDVFGTQSGA